MKTLVQSLVISRLDYGNALLAEAPDYIIKRLQRVQNMAARVVTGLRKYDHITEARYELHWLPVDKRIDFKILLLTYKALNGLAPGYLSDLLVHYSQGRSLRPRELIQLVEPRTQRGYGERCFSVAAPKVWNKLPIELRNAPSVQSFKCQLKSHLFCKAHNC